MVISIIIIVMLVRFLAGAAAAEIPTSLGIRAGPRLFEQGNLLVDSALVDVLHLQLLLGLLVK